jgi:Zn-dependent protease
LFYGLFSTVGLILFLAVSGLTVLIHELGHAITARNAGADVLSVNLQGFGGFTAWLPNEKITVMQRFWVAAAGPLYQLALGVAVYVAIAAGVLGDRWPELLAGPLDWTILRVADVNGQWLQFVVISMALLSVLWAVFNLAPIFGLDGYTMVRQLMIRFSPERGDDLARVIGLVVSVGLIGFFAMRGAYFGAIWIGYIAFSNYSSATRKEPLEALQQAPLDSEAAAQEPVQDLTAEGEYWPYERLEGSDAEADPDGQA